MKKEIGGYFELEEMAGEEYYPNLYKVNLGRTALLWLLETRQYKKIYLPVFLCRSVIDICRDHDIEVEFYHLDADLNILLETSGRGMPLSGQLLWSAYRRKNPVLSEGLWQRDRGSYTFIFSETA